MRLAALTLLACLAPAADLPAVHPLFDGDRVHDLHIYFDRADWYQVLRSKFEGKTELEYTEATLVWGDLKLERIGVRFKGNSSYRSYPTTKKSFKLKTNEFVKGQRIEGIDTFNLNNSFRDPALVREKVYYELAREAGLTAPRVNYAAVHVNGEFWGLYFLTEDVEGTFLKNHLGRKENGNLYKGEPRGTLEWRGTDPAVYKTLYEKQTNEAKDDWTDLIALLDVLNRTPPAQLKEKLEPLLDIESALSLLALDILTANLDSYIGSGHNYYLYRRESDGKFTFIPWDPNEAFGCFNLGLSIPQLQQLPLFYLPKPQAPPGQPAPPANAVVPRPLAQRLWDVPELRAAYVEKVKALMKGPAATDTLLDRVAALRDLAAPFILMEQRSMFSQEDWTRAVKEDVRVGNLGFVPGLDAFIRQRGASLLAQLEAQGW